MRHRDVGQGCDPGPNESFQQRTPDREKPLDAPAHHTHRVEENECVVRRLGAEETLEKSRNGFGH